jgi:hypothetical protein
MSNLSAIGFGVSSEEAFHGTIERAMQHAVAPAELGGWAAGHLWCHDPSGAAIAFHLGKRGIKCITPFFLPKGGGTTWLVRTTAPHRDRECVDCSGADCDILAGSPPEMVTRSAVQWLYFDAYADWLGQDRQYELQVVGFASELHLCNTEEEWEAVQSAAFGGTRAPGEKLEPGKTLRMADEAFLPHGMFANDGDLGQRARALVTGHVVQLSHPTNELGGERFTWVRLATLGGQLDVVSPFAGEAQATPAMRAFADVWLVGRPLAPPPAKRGFWQRLTGGG